MKFKKGDKVRRITYDVKGVNIGDEVVIVNLLPGGFMEIEGQGDTKYHEDFFELVNKKITKEELKNKLDSFKENINSWKEAKEGSLKKWMYIYSNIDEIDWKDDIGDAIWQNCALCVYRNKVEGEEGRCGSCPLITCTGDTEKGIRNATDNCVRPKEQDILDFIKRIQDISLPEEKEEGVFKNETRIFEVSDDGSIEIKDTFANRKISIVESLPTLYKAVELSKRRYENGRRE